MLILVFVCFIGLISFSNYKLDSGYHISGVSSDNNKTDNQFMVTLIFYIGYSHFAPSQTGKRSKLLKCPKPKNHSSYQFFSQNPSVTSVKTKLKNDLGQIYTHGHNYT